MTVTRPVGFLTDYGPHTEYVGAVHAVVASIAPGADRLDLAHDIPAGDIRWGAIVLERLLHLMPRGSVTMAVVDPGVGTERRPVAVELEWGRVAIGPDNGLLGLLTDRLGATRAVHITSRDHMREPVSDTFHGRDIFAPAAAHVAGGVPLDALGPAVDLVTLQRPPLPDPQAAGGTLEALVVGVDAFGNLALWAVADDLMAAGLVQGAGAWVATAGAGQSGARVGRTFGDVPRGSLLVYVDSHGLVSIAMNGGSAQERVRATPGEVIAVMRQE